MSRPIHTDHPRGPVRGTPGYNIPPMPEGKPGGKRKRRKPKQLPGQIPGGPPAR